MSETAAALGALLLPPELSPWVAAVLVGTSFVASALAGALGLGGGVLMLAVLATFLPPTTVIPVHGVVQIGSNLGRAVLLRRAVDTTLLVPFSLGSVIGVGIGALLIVEVPRDLLRLILGLFVLWSCLGPRLRAARLPARGFALVGVVTSVLTMFVGATGPFVAAFVSPDRLTRHGVVATHAACMCVQHSFKVAAFTALGFAFLPWLPFLALMIGLGFLGTMAGKRFLDRLPEAAFGRAFRAVLVLLALRLLWDGLAGLAGA